NISSQIFFQILKYRNNVSECVGMIQKEVAERIAAGPGSKTYGILSVLLQAWYDIEYLFTVHENVFNPPPKVKSAVIRLKRNNVNELGCDEKMFVTVVKQAFNQRRKTLRNSLRSLIPSEIIDNEIFNKRPEQLSVAEFVELVKQLQ
ncbi:MAG: 16S rRNA (adenine(1518)-N(6)/adenine(1519)-N(6))-dimethyltransferase, partial [Bacteroidales bacterium]|nr:16S rRNA (adenine(1518)-N(6)/adenine(1519)-N(6))-dimethyltransferase [Bacteroidales bacterium]